MCIIYIIYPKAPKAKHYLAFCNKMQSYTSIFNWKRATPTLQSLTLTESLLWRFTKLLWCEHISFRTGRTAVIRWYIEAVLPENIHPSQRDSQKSPATGPNKHWKNSLKSKIYWVAGTVVGDFDVPNVCRHHSLCHVPRIMEDRRLILREKSNTSMETYTKNIPKLISYWIKLIPGPSLCALLLSISNLPPCNSWIICWYCKIQAGTCLSKLVIVLRHHSTETKTAEPMA